MGFTMYNNKAFIFFFLCLTLFFFFFFITSGCEISDQNPPNLLDSNCFDWPETELSEINKSNLTTGLAEGTQAIDFTLMDPSGTSYILSDLLKTKPVFLVFGAFT